VAHPQRSGCLGCCHVCEPLERRLLRVVRAFRVAGPTATAIPTRSGERGPLIVSPPMHDNRPHADAAVRAFHMTGSHHHSASHTPSGVMHRKPSAFPLSRDERASMSCVGLGWQRPRSLTPRDGAGRLRPTYPHEGEGDLPSGWFGSGLWEYAERLPARPRGVGDPNFGRR
jgi:hypothetical protein